MEITAPLAEPVLWSEGMLLGPQHLQQHDLYWRGQLRHQMAQLQPHYWGVIDLEIDESRLRKGEIRVARIQAVMPDGCVVQFPAPGQEDVLSLDLSARPEWKDQRPVKVYLAIPAIVEGTASERHYAVGGSMEVDSNTGEGRVAVPRLRTRLSLLTEDRLAPKFVTLPLLEVQRDFGGNFELTAFHPPLLRTQASSFLGTQALQGVLMGLTSRLRDKIRELIGTRTDANGAASQAVVRPISAALPPLEVMVAGGTSHPRDLYIALANLVGHVAAIGNDPVPLLMEPYQHNDLMPGFVQAVNHIQSILDRLKAGYQAFPFEAKGGGQFVRALPEEVGDRLVIELRAHPGQTRETLALWAKQAVIGTESMLDTLRKRRLPGAGRRLLRPDEMAEIDLQGTGLLLEVTNLSVDDAAVIQSGRPLHIEGAEIGAPATIVFYRQNPTAGARGKGGSRG